MVALQPEVGRGGVLDELVCFDLYAASRAVTGTYRPLLDELGLTYPQYLVVVCLGDTGGPTTIRDLGAALRLDHATLAPLLCRLVEAGVVQKRASPDDARAVLVSLTARGRRLHRRLDDVRCAVREALGLTDRQLRDLQETLRRVARNVDAAG